MEVLLHETPTTLGQIENFEYKTGFTLSESFKSFCCSKYHLLAVDVKEEVWERPYCGQRGPEWTFSYGFDIHGFDVESDEQYYIPKLYEYMKSECLTDTVPFLNIATDSDPFCFCKDDKIRQYECQKSGMEYDMDFLDFFELQLKELCERKEAYKQLGSVDNA